MARVLLGVTGGIAAYKACELCRLLVQAGHEVTPLLRPGAEPVVTADCFRAPARAGARRVEEGAGGRPPEAADEGDRPDRVQRRLARRRRLRRARERGRARLRASRADRAEGAKA